MTSTVLFKPLVGALFAAALFAYIAPGISNGQEASPGAVSGKTNAGAGRGFPLSSPWVSCYGSAKDLGDLGKVAKTFRVINIDADPGLGNFSAAQVKTLQAGGKNRVISYLNIGSMESFRDYWQSVPAGFVSGKANKTAHRGAYSGYPNETWMDLSNADYQKLIVEYVAPRLVAQGVDGFYLDNMEMVEHGTATKNGPCSDTCRQGGLDLVRRLREKFPRHLIVMQNATSDTTRRGVTGGVSFPTLLDGIAHEEVYAPRYDREAERQLQAWRKMMLLPGGKRFWIGTEDYVGSCKSSTAAKSVYKRSRAQGFSPYVTDASAGQQGICYWSFASRYGDR